MRSSCSVVSVVVNIMRARSPNADVDKIRLRHMALSHFIGMTAGVMSSCVCKVVSGQRGNGGMIFAASLSGVCLMF